MTKPAFPVEEVRDDLIPLADYLDRDFAALEARNLWPKVWQQACRLEEIEKVGDFVVYEILDDSILVVRTGEGEADIAAMHNVCPHRGTLLAEGTGHVREFLCPFHGWRFGLDGENLEVVDRGDWGNCLADADTNLSRIQHGVWGGWVWINMDPDCQPLAEFLEPMASRCGLHEFEKLRLAWYKTTTVEANWKTTMEAFMEFYHVQTTHRQMLTYTRDYSTSRGMGRHGWMSYEFDTGLPVGRSERLEPKEVADFREYLYEYGRQFKEDLGTMQTERGFQAIQRLRELPADTPPEEVLAQWGANIYTAAIESGAGWPEGITPEYMAETGFDWAVFPNTVFLHPAIESVLWYRFRPHPDDFEKTVMDTYSLERFAPGEQPEWEHQVFARPEDGDYPLIYRQDFENIPRVQKGMKSSGFRAARTNPYQERAIANFHRRLREFLIDPHAGDNLKAESRLPPPDKCSGDLDPAIDRVKETSTDQGMQ